MAKTRDNLSMRPVKIQRRALLYPAGSAIISMGNTRVLCTATVEKGKPRWMKEKGGWVTAEYSLLPASTSERTRRERGKVSGRTSEIQRLIGRSLRSVIDLAAIDDLTIIVDCDVIQADGGTRTAAITGGYVALYDALRSLCKQKIIPAMPLKDQVAAISVGMWKGQVALDLDYEKDSTADVDMNVVMTGSGKIVEVQGTAEREPFSRQQLDRMLDVAEKGISELIAVQKKALRVK